MKAHVKNFFLTDSFKRAHYDLFFARGAVLRARDKEQPLAQLDCGLQGMR
jgi:hypothetical protein